MFSLQLPCKKERALYDVSFNQGARLRWLLSGLKILGFSLPIEWTIDDLCSIVDRDGAEREYRERGYAEGLRPRVILLRSWQMLCSKRRLHRFLWRNPENRKHRCLFGQGVGRWLGGWLPNFFKFRSQLVTRPMFATKNSCCIFFFKIDKIDTLLYRPKSKIYSLNVTFVAFRKCYVNLLDHCKIPLNFTQRLF